MNHINIPEELHIAYRETNYIVFYQKKEIVLRVGKYSVEMDFLLDEFGFNSYAFITAANPYSTQKSRKENIQLNLELQNKMKQKGFKYVNGIGESLDKTWREESFCIFEIELKEANALALYFSQNAFIYGKRNFPPELILCSKKDSG